VAAVSAKTGQLTKPFDPAIEKTIDFSYNAYSVSTQSGGLGVSGWWRMLPLNSRRNRQLPWSAA
jgi:hypothetical protein